MGVSVFDDFEADNGTNRRPAHHVARPMHVVVHPRNANEPRTGIKHRAHIPHRMRPPELGLASDCRCECKSRDRMARWKGSILIGATRTVRRVYAAKRGASLPVSSGVL